MVRHTEFTVADVETTGLFPGGSDRIVEIAAIRINHIGRVLGEFVSLVNPKRDVGATHIHGISARDVVHAPTFDEIAGDVLSILSESVFVAHNASFDKRFVCAEITRTGCEIFDFPHLCTMQLARRADPYIPSRKLQELCKYFSIKHDRAHSAHADALATANLFTTSISRIGDPTRLSLADIGVKNKPVGKKSWPTLPVSGKYYRRERAAADADKQPSYIARLVSKLPSATHDQLEIEEYLACIDRVLEDRRVSYKEFQELQGLTQELGISRQQAIDAHRKYMRDLIIVALGDNIITDSEKADPDEVRKLLDIPRSDYHALLHEVIKEHETGTLKRRGISGTINPEIIGKTICFTGTMTCMINGIPARRAFAERSAMKCGLAVMKNVTRDLDFLVVADPDTMSGKAKKARDYGIRIIAEPVFWRMVGVDVE